MVVDVRRRARSRSRTSAHRDHPSVVRAALPRTRHRHRDLDQSARTERPQPDRRASRSDRARVALDQRHRRAAGDRARLDRRAGLTPPALHRRDHARRWRLLRRHDPAAAPHRRPPCRRRSFGRVPGVPEHPTRDPRHDLLRRQSRTHTSGSPSHVAAPDARLRQSRRGHQRLPHRFRRWGRSRTVPRCGDPSDHRITRRFPLGRGGHRRSRPHGSRRRVTHHLGQSGLG